MVRGALGLGWVLCGILAGCAADDVDGSLSDPTKAEAAAFEVAPVSTRADHISGGDVLLRLSPAPDASTLQILRGGVPLPVVLRDVNDAGAQRVLLSGLQHGVNAVEVQAQLGGQAVTRTLNLTNHPLTGPIFSGPHQQPFFCRTAAAGLGEALDADCSAETQVTYLYKRQGFLNTELVTLADPTAPYPEDLEQTTTTEGETVPFIVRVESGTINRSIYRIAVLDDPQARAPGAPYVPSKGWNRRLIYSFGGGCGAGLHQGGGDGSYARIAEVTLPWIMADGYAQIVSSLNEFGTSCNDVLSAETAMMVKEAFIERYGVPVWTMGRGGSGGAIQQQMIAQNYPGLLDGLVVRASFPDNTTLLPEVLDCRLLRRVFATRPLIWTTLKQSQVSGFATANTCAQWANGFAPIVEDPASGCPADLPVGAIYDPVNNPQGVRCTVPETLRNVYGTDAQTGFAQNWYDNEGVQYGLEALKDGRLTPQWFIDLNRDIGGLDVDGQWQAGRTRAAASVLRTAYQSGRISSGDALGELPVLDINYFADRIVGQNIHDRIRPFTTRERIRRAHGDAQTHVMWTYNFTGLIYQPFVRPDADGAGVDTMRDWLDALVVTPRARADVIATKPDAARDRCVLADGTPPIYETAGAPGICQTVFKPSSTPRLVAGAPMSNDVLKCQLKPIDRNEYGSAARWFSEAQWQALAEVFPDGVCDYSLAGVEQAAPVAPWLEYSQPFDL